MPFTYQRLLIAALCALTLAGPATAQATFLGDVRLSAPDAPRFGGLSAIEMGDDGLSGVVLSDRGTLFDLRVTRAGTRITDVDICCSAGVSGPDGGHLPTPQRDSEGLAILPNGTIAISFEGQPFARVALHTRNGAEIRALPGVPGAEALPVNGAFEGLAADTSGRLYTLPEAMPGQGPIPLLRLDQGRWTLFAELPRAPGWSPVALDIDDRGRLYLLQRRASIWAGFSTRLTRYGLRPDGLGRPEVLFQSAAGQHGNLEGLSLWRDATGRLIATMVSDDNFLPIFATTLVEYSLPD